MSRSPDYLLARIDLLESLVDQMIKNYPVDQETAAKLNQCCAHYSKERSRIEEQFPAPDAPRIELLTSH